MKILIDIVHPADVNFYKNAIEQLSTKYEIVLTVLHRGKLLDIVKKEYPNQQIIPLGKHRVGKIKKIFGLLDREAKFTLYFLRNKIDRVSSFGFYPAIAAKLFGIRSILFYDDFEYKFNFNMCKTFGDSFIIPDSIPVSANNIRKYTGFKELAYLATFTPTELVLQEYNLTTEKYVFVRDVAAVSLNYADLHQLDLLPLFENLKQEGYTILYYGEDKLLTKKYESVCTIIHEPIKDIHSLIYYAKLTISSGDTIARESALLGTPVLYVGKRKMCVNNKLIEIGSIIEADTIADAQTSVARISGQQYKADLRKKISELTEKEWEDVTSVIIEGITHT